MVLYKRDCWRSYTPPDHWLVRDIKVAAFLADLEKGRRAPLLLLQTTPHIIPHEERVRLFRKYIANEKTVLGLTESACAASQSTLITVHRCFSPSSPVGIVFGRFVDRNRIVEDGYRQLTVLPAQALKGVIRVRFINEYGLDEAGIDQDGVFKEFLEESVKRVFDPALNLFKATSEERLYPSPTSHLQDNHLQLFEFTGKILGKAVYEGIVVDVPFASFFLSQVGRPQAQPAPTEIVLEVSGQTSQALYSSVDELPSLDPALYRSLSYVKHYEDDVADLNLTFSVDDDHMGRVVTHELIPGGRAVPVTKDNMYSLAPNPTFASSIWPFQHQLHPPDGPLPHARPDQGANGGVHQRLPLHRQPRLADALLHARAAAADLGRQHSAGPARPAQTLPVLRRLPRLAPRDWLAVGHSGARLQRRGAAHVPQICHQLLEAAPAGLCASGAALLHPLRRGGRRRGHRRHHRCVSCTPRRLSVARLSVAGSVFRGFFTIRKKDPQNRLPTSSTCFNLLKLPNYQKKSTLREKLRYAVSCNTGFELS